MELLKMVDGWFLMFLIVIMGGAITALASYAVWSVKQILRDIRQSIKDLQETIKELLDYRTEHERRLSVIEERCRLKASSSCGCNHTI